MMSKKSFVLYTEWEDAFDGQPNDVAGELIKMIFDYVRTGEVLKSDNPVVNAMFSIFRPAIDRNIDKYDEVVEKRREAGRLGGLKKAQNIANVASASKCKQNVANVADSVSDSVSDTLSLKGESAREEANKVFVLQSIKEQLLFDEIWKESFCMQSTLGVSFISMFPEQIDKFITYIVSIGEERTISNLSDAKRRFTYWWQNYGRKEVQNENKQEYIIPD